MFDFFRNVRWNLLFMGIVAIVVGIIMIKFPQTAIDIIKNSLNYIFGAIVLFLGLNLVIEGFISKKYETSHWGQTLLMGLICIALAVLIVFNPFGEKAFLIVTGVSFIIAGLMNIFVSGRVGMAAHRFNVAVKAVENGMTETIVEPVVNVEPNSAIEEVLVETEEKVADA